MHFDLLYKLVATQYPGAVRVLSVNLVSFFCISEISDFFSISLLTISFITSVSGVAVSTQAYVSQRFVSTLYSLTLIVVLTILAAPLAINFWEGSFEDFSKIVFISIFYSLFEVFRAHSMSRGEFKNLSIRGLFCILMVLISVLTFNENHIALTGAVFISIFLTIISRKCVLRSCSERKKIIAKDIASYSLSNLFSTGFSFLFPLILIQEYGSSSATVITQIFTFSVVFFAYPRLLSSVFLNQYKVNRETAKYINFDKDCYRFNFIIIIFISLVVFGLAPNLLEYLMFIIALVCSQLSLPASNLIMAEGQGVKLMKINLVSLLMLLLCIALAKFFLDPSALRTQLILFSYLSFNIGKYVVLKFHTIPSLIELNRKVYINEAV